MKATEILMEEHRVIERILNALEKAANRLSRGEEVYLRFFNGTSFFIKGFADGCHHKKEEDILYPALLENGLSNESGPIAVMLAEHEQARQLAERMRTAIEQFQAGNVHARNLVIQNANGYVRLLRQHIYKENNVLFPMVDKVIPATQQEQFIDGFQQFEHADDGEEVHEKYYGLAERLEKECSR